MRTGHFLVLASTLLCSRIASVLSFHVSPGILSFSSALRKSGSALGYSEDEDDIPLRPDTSFGADAVPEEQRPVNEYLDVTSQPMFGWASLESGNKGLMTRLVVVYSVLFGVVCYPIAGATFTQDGEIFDAR